MSTRIYSLELKHLVWPLSAVLFVLIVLEVAPLLHTGDNQPLENPPSSLSNNSHPSLSRDNQKFNDVVDKNLFGIQSATPLETEDNAPETNLELKLYGIFSGLDNQQGYAIILSKGKQQKNFSVGESIYGLAILHAIYTDHVILRRHNQYETLQLPSDSSDIDIQNPLVISSHKEHSTTIKTPPLDEFEYYVTLSSEEDPDSDDGRLLGYSLRPANIQGKEWLRRLGVQTDDILVSINGVMLDTEKSYDTLESTLAEGKPVTAIISRNGSTSSITLQ